jgi:replication initiation protein RepC
MDILPGHHDGCPTGLRRLTPSLLQAIRAAEDFTGLPQGASRPGQVLAAFKAAAPCLGLAPRLVHAIDWLFKFTQPQDWKPGARPIVWPSAATQQEALGLSESGVRAINRGLIEAGLVAMQDSPNGKRWGRRDRDGRIAEAYGFDLSPLAVRHAEFVVAAAEARVERTERGQLRRRATIARNGIVQILETAAEYGFAGDEWATLLDDANHLAGHIRRIESIEEMMFAVAGLERRQLEARKCLENRLAEAASGRPDSSYTAGKPAEYCGHNIPTNPADDLKPDTVAPPPEAAGTEPDDVIAPQECGGASVPPPEAARTTAETAAPLTQTAQGLDTAQPAPERPAKAPPLRLTIDELLILAPRLQTYLTTPNPVWRDIVDAADWLRGEMGISRPLWGEACVAMGRECAAVAVALVSARPAEHFRSSPGGYFHGMVRKAKAGELNLVRTIWGLRQARAAKVRAGRPMH